MNNYLISVIIPTFNAEKTIDRALQSVLKQSYKNFEIICVDDCSSDCTVQIIKHVQKTDDRIVLFENAVNMKSAYSRNKAIQKAKGEFIMQLDADDVCFENRMVKQLEYLHNHPDIDFVGSNSFVFNKKGIYAKIKTVSFPTNKDFLRTSPYVNSSVMFRKKALLAIGGYRISSETKRCQDYDLYMRLYINGSFGFNLQDFLISYYRDNNYFKKINLYNRIGEMKFRYRNFKKMGLLPRYFIYIFKPILVIFLPSKLLFFLSKRQLENL